VQVPPANSQWSHVTDTLARFSAALTSVWQESASTQARVSSAEQKLEIIEKQQAEVVKLQAGLVGGLGKQDLALDKLKREVHRLQSMPAELAHALDAVRALDGRLDAVDKRSAEHGERALSRVESLAQDLSKTQRSIHTGLGEQAGETSRRVGAVEGEVEACRRQLTEVQSIAGRMSDLGTDQATLQSRVEDLLMAARVQVEHHVSSAALKLREHIEEESKQVGSELMELVDTLRVKAEKHRQKLAEEYEAELYDTLSGMKGALDLEIHHSCRELSWMLSTWQDGLMKATDTWAAHLENRQLAGPCSPQKARQAASGFSDALQILSEQLARLRDPGSSSDLEDRWPSGQPQLCEDGLTKSRLQCPWTPPPCLASPSRRQR